MAASLRGHAPRVLPAGVEPRSLPDRETLCPVPPRSRPRRTVSEIEVSRASAADLLYVVSLMRANRESVGGLPAPAISERIERGTVLLGAVNDDPVGYLLYDYRGGEIRVPQACIQYDARRRLHGAELLDALYEAHPDARQVSLRCAADLEANLFWRDMGFTCTGTVPGGRRRGRTINCWTRWLEPRLFPVEAIAVEPAAEIRTDLRYDDSAYLDAAPEGFAAARVLPKLAWSNRRNVAKKDNRA